MSSPAAVALQACLLFAQSVTSQGADSYQAAVLPLGLGITVAAATPAAVCSP